jgi:hypothetical protein
MGVMQTVHHDALRPARFRIFRQGNHHMTIIVVFTAGWATLLRIGMHAGTWHNQANKGTMMWYDLDFYLVCNEPCHAQMNQELVL